MRLASERYESHDGFGSNNGGSITPSENYHSGGMFSPINASVVSSVKNNQNKWGTIQ